MVPTYVNEGRPEIPANESAAVLSWTMASYFKEFKL